MYHNLQAAREKQDRQRRVVRWIAAFVGLGLVVLLASLLAMSQGLLAIGTSYKYQQWSKEPENFYGIAGWNSGHSWGLDTFYFRRGQKIYIEYDAVIYQGDVVVRVYQLAVPGLPEAMSRSIIKSGKGRLEAVIPENGFYSFSYFSSLAIGSGTGAHEAQFNVSWGVVN